MSDVTIGTLFAGDIKFPNVGREIDRNSSIYEIYKSSDIARDPEQYNALPLKQRFAIQIANPTVQGLMKVVPGMFMATFAGVHLVILASAGVLTTAMIAPSIALLTAVLFIMIGMYQLIK